MKKLIPKTIFALALCSIVALTISFTSKPVKKEVMVIKTYVSFEPEGAGLAIFHNDKQTEFKVISHESLYNSSDEGEDIMKKLVDEDGKMLLNILQRFYDQGWELTGITGSELPTYILTR